MKNPKKGIGRIVNAFWYSISGLRACLNSEAAFRQEVFLAVIMLLIACFAEVSPVERLILIGSVFLVLIVELLNTAIEQLADKISSEFDSHIKTAKDVGSAAVMLSLVFAGISWLLILF